MHLCTTYPSCTGCSLNIVFFPKIFNILRPLLRQNGGLLLVVHKMMSQYEWLYTCTDGLLFYVHTCRGWVAVNWKKNIFFLEHPAYVIRFILKACALPLNPGTYGGAAPPLVIPEIPDILSKLELLIKPYCNRSNYAQNLMLLSLLLLKALCKLSDVIAKGWVSWGNMA